ncbi:hypothetical protein CPAR01_01731 [Colletotrichum paranaense]|uniref:Uncharacterized protein n=1 Tax=Colletotrichum paranaense TaxID=1914294 RepID=A0ABQ9T8A5_9PEZI|nr:uncharacterized protein CPAR01_01731 [Colletotrichum paranaense]KAK1547764.1 hypothetical protein CPAR01_01731 [Colletotrichum paranaense]
MYACHSHGWSEARQPALTTSQSIIELRKEASGAEQQLFGDQQQVHRTHASTLARRPITRCRLHERYLKVLACTSVGELQGRRMIGLLMPARGHVDHFRILESLWCSLTLNVVDTDLDQGNHVVKVEIQSRLCRNVAACSRVVFRVSLPLYICASRGRPIVPGQ